MLLTDYLVIGAGAASMAFVDTLLTEQPDASVIIVDGHAAPGGHWNDAYDFVRLHQPSLLYGVSSSQMEGNWMKLLLKGTLPWNHRASKEEILTYYRMLMDTWIASGRVQYYPNCMYNFQDTNNHSFRTVDGTKTYNIRVTVKLVNGISGECCVPSKTPPTFPVDNNVKMMTPNQVYDSLHDNTQSWKLPFYGKKNASRKYVVLGAGKTATDSVVYLQRHGVAADDISWVVPNDVWFMRREGPGGPWAWGDALLEKDLDVDAAALYLEKQGVFTRLDTNVMPTKFRFPVVGADEMKLLRKVKNVIRRGRVTSIAEDGRVSFTKGDPLVFGDHVFVRKRL